jgi:hypothetical protein
MAKPNLLCTVKATAAGAAVAAMVPVNICFLMLQRHALGNIYQQSHTPHCERSLTYGSLLLLLSLSLLLLLLLLLLPPRLPWLIRHE